MKKTIFKTITFLLLFINLLLSKTTIPDTFDLRNYNGNNYVSSVKSQQGGTCWTHGTMASIEGNLIITGNWIAQGETGEPNLAEYHLDWWNGFNQFNNDDILPNSGGLTVHQGGDYRVSTAYLSRSEGAVRDIDGQSYDTNPQRNSAQYHYYYPRNVEWYVINSALTNIDTVKKAIMKYGVLATCICYNGNFINGNFVHYQPDSTSDDPNHSVAIIGWNDNKETQADDNGAWLVKNSWGPDWGENGYFWISYYDKHCGKHPEMGAVSFQDIEGMKYDKIYYHDYHGWRDTKTDVSKAFNCFLSENSSNSEEIIAVSFFVASNKVDYTIKIYDDFNGNSLSNLLTEQSGYIEHTGFHTIDLNSSVSLTKNDSFFVFVELNKGGHPYDCTSEIPVLLSPDNISIPNQFLKFKSSITNTIVKSTANIGESYYFVGENIHDLYDFDSTANFCIKALVNYTTGTSNSNTIEKFSLKQNYPNPFNSTTTIEYSIPNTQRVMIKIFDIQGREVAELVNGNMEAGTYEVKFDGSKYASGIYFYQLRTADYLEVKKMVLMK